MCVLCVPALKPASVSLSHRIKKKHLQCTEEKRQELNKTNANVKEVNNIYHETTIVSLWTRTNTNATK